MNYQETLNWLFAQLPMYQREGQAAYKANLDNTLQLDEYFRHPHKNFKTIHEMCIRDRDMAVQNVIGDSFRGATWVSLHNGGGVGWGEVINGGFGMLLDGSADADRRLKNMLFWDVNNGISRRSWARNEGAVFAIKRAMEALSLIHI